MMNGKLGDHPYTDILVHNLDLGEPEIAARRRAVHSIADLEVQEMLSDLFEYLFPGSLGGVPEDYQRERLLRHLDTIEALCAGTSGKKKT